MKWSKVSKIRRIVKQQAVFDITNHFHNFIANGILVHNCTFCFHEGHSRMDLVRSYGEEKIKEMEKEVGKHIPMVRFRSPEKVVEHILWLRKMYACDFISCLDENILCDRKRFMKLCELMVDEDLHKVLRWGILGDVASVDEDMLRLFRDSGGAYCSYGGESCSDRLLKEIGKHTLKRQQQAAIDVSFKCQINPIMTYMCGFESETIDDILETVEFWILNKMACDPFYITPYPGTELYLKHKDRILSQYGGDLDKFLCSLGDATDLSVNISPWKDWELIALKQLMFKRDVRRIMAFAKERGWHYSPEWEGKLPNLEAALESQRG